METRTLATDYGDVTIREWGSGGRLLLALHGMDIDSSGAVFDPAMVPLAQAGHHVVAPDLPGFGLTPAIAPEEYDIALLADRLWAVPEALGVNRVGILGAGWGAHLAERMAMESGPAVAALVLVDAGHRDQPDTAPADVALTLDQWRERAREVRGRWPVDAPGIASADALAAAAHQLSRFRVSATWPAIQEELIPTLLLLATEPPEVADLNLQDAHTFQAVVHTVEVRPARGASHAMVTELQEAFGLFVSEWIAPHA